MNFIRIPSWLYVAFAVLMIVALVFHWQHILAYAPFIFILLCPLLHVFHGHGRHDRGRHNGDERHSHHG